jgi:metal-responsive CopG/Arc/MetJ family transcriptional regulator
MPTVKIAITIDQEVLQRLDAMVARKSWANRSRAIQAAVSDQLTRLEGSRLAAECARLDPQAEKAMAEEGMTMDVAAWPKY